MRKDSVARLEQKEEDTKEEGSEMTGHPNVYLSKRERRRLRQALTLAIDYELSFIDAHRTELFSRKGRIETREPREHRQIVAKTNRNIAAFRTIQEKLFWKEDR